MANGWKHQAMQTKQSHEFVVVVVHGKVAKEILSSCKKNIKKKTKTTQSHLPPLS
jgi:hypothetical protein